MDLFDSESNCSDSSDESPVPFSDVESDSELHAVIVNNLQKTATKAQEEVRFPCDLCPKICKTSWGLKRHTIAIHKMKSAPFSDAFTGLDSNEILSGILTSILSDICFGHVARQRKAVCEALLKNIASPHGCEFVKTVWDFMLEVFKRPSSRLSLVCQYEENLKAVNLMLSGGDDLSRLVERATCCVKMDLEDIEETIVRMVLFRVCHKLLEKLQAVALQHRRNKENPEEVAVPGGMGEEEIKNFELTIQGMLQSYYMQGIKKFTHGKLLLRLKCVMQGLCISDISPLTGPDFCNKQMWDGGNIHVAPSALKFFVSVENLIRSFQKEPDKSVSIDSVMDELFNDVAQEAFNLWFECTKQYLSEANSLGLMRSLVSALIKLSNQANASLLRENLIEEKRKSQKVALRPSLKKNK